VRHDDSYLDFDNLRVNPCGFVNDGFPRRFEIQVEQLALPSFQGKQDQRTADYLGWVQAFAE